MLCTVIFLGFRMEVLRGDDEVHIDGTLWALYIYLGHAYCQDTSRSHEIPFAQDTKQCCHMANSNPWNHRKSLCPLLYLVVQLHTPTIHKPKFSHNHSTRHGSPTKLRLLSCIELLAYALAKGWSMTARQEDWRSPSRVGTCSSRQPWRIQRASRSNLNCYTKSLLFVCGTIVVPFATPWVPCGASTRKWLLLHLEHEAWLYWTPNKNPCQLYKDSGFDQGLYSHNAYPHNWQSEHCGRLKPNTIEESLASNYAAWIYKPSYIAAWLR